MAGERPNSLGEPFGFDPKAAGEIGGIQRRNAKWPDGRRRGRPVTFIAPAGSQRCRSDSGPAHELALGFGNGLDLFRRDAEVRYDHFPQEGVAASCSAKHLRIGVL